MKQFEDEDDDEDENEHARFMDRRREGLSATGIRTSDFGFRIFSLDTPEGPGNNAARNERVELV